MTKYNKRRTVYFCEDLIHIYMSKYIYMCIFLLSCLQKRTTLYTCLIYYFCLIGVGSCFIGRSPCITCYAGKSK